MKRRDLEKHLREHECRFIGEGSRHAKWRGPRGAPATVPRHREIKPGTVRTICKQLGVPEPVSLTSLIWRAPMLRSRLVHQSCTSQQPK